MGFSDYQINLSGALICGYTGVGPDAIVNRAAVKSPTRGQEIALDVLAAAPVSYTHLDVYKRQAKHIVCTASTTTNEISGEFVTVFSMNFRKIFGNVQKTSCSTSSARYESPIIL